MVSRRHRNVDFIVLKCLKFNCFVLQSQKVKCYRDIPILILDHEPMDTFFLFSRSFLKLLFSSFTPAKCKLLFIQKESI